MKKLKTLKDMFSYDPEEHTAAWHAASQYYKKEIKAEAIKWVKFVRKEYDYTDREDQLLMDFFNLTEEDLKDGPRED